MSEIMKPTATEHSYEEKTLGCHEEHRGFLADHDKLSVSPTPCPGWATPQRGSKLTVKELFHLSFIPLVFIIWTLSIYVTFLCTRHAYMPTSRSFETGFDTELEPIWGVISLEKIRFTGDLKVDPNGTVYREVVGRQYVGPPSPEIDDAWVDIIRGGGVDLVGVEAESVAHKTYRKPGGWWLTGTHVFHQLHCLNKLRMSTHPEYYTQHDFEPLENWRMHLDHCIDIIRQSLQCSADMTKIDVVWNEAKHRIVPDLNGEHVCRNFRQLQSWMLDGSRNSELHKIH